MTPDLRRPAQSVSNPPKSAIPQYYDASSTSQAMNNSRKRERDDPVDWENYFGGKPPKEIIVIDDDEEEASQPQSNHNTSVTQAAPAPPTNGDLYHADKRRKTTASTAYDPVYQAHGQYSNTQTPYYDDSPRHYTGSTDRTASYNTTAPTSLGSASSGNAYNDDASVGQKRKRSSRQAAQEVKKREIDFHADPYADYIPPPKPPIKAKDVHVVVIPDVGGPFFMYSLTSADVSAEISDSRPESR